MLALEAVVSAQSLCQCAWHVVCVGEWGGCINYTG